MPEKSGRGRAAKWGSILTGGILTLILFVGSGVIPTAFTAKANPSVATLSISTADLQGNPLAGSYIGNVVDITTGQVIYLGSLNTPQTFQGLTVGQQYSVTVNDNSPLYVVAASVGTFIRTTTGGGGAGVTTLTLQGNTGVVFSLSPTPPTNSTTTTSTTTTSTTTSTTTASTTTISNPAIQIAMPCSFYIFVDTAGFYNAQNCYDGRIVYGGVANAGGATGTDFASVFVKVLSASVTAPSCVISLGAGTFTMQSNLVVPNNTNCIISGAGRPSYEYAPADGTNIVTNGHMITQSATQWSGGQGGTFRLRDLAISLTNGGYLNLRFMVVFADNVMWRATGAFAPSPAVITLGSGGPPGSTVVWNNMYFYDSRGGTSANQYGIFLNVWYEGFSLNEFGITVNVVDPIGWLNFFKMTGNTFASFTHGDMYLSGPFYTSPNKYQTYIESYYDLYINDIEFPDSSQIGTAMLFDLAASGVQYYTITSARTHEVGPYLVPSTGTSGGTIVKAYLGAQYNSYGVATISSSTTVAVAHNLVCTPTVVMVTPESTGYGAFYVTSITSSSFVIAVTSSGTYTFSWSARC